MMHITYEVYKKLLALPEVPPETGGIIAGKNHIVTKIHLDNGKKRKETPTMYRPDFSALNQVIASWQREGFEFYGVFHSHSNTDRALSPADRKYIARIMLAMPSPIQTLHFPLVFPNDTILFYRADRCDTEVSITCEEIEILY